MTQYCGEREGLATFGIPRSIKMLCWGFCPSQEYNSDSVKLIFHSAIASNFTKFCQVSSCNLGITSIGSANIRPILSA